MRANFMASMIAQRCWHDAEDVPSPPDHFDPLMRTLKRGEVGVSFFPTGTRQILPESSLTLVDRIFQPGDLCKKSIDDVQSGVITSVDVKARLEHAVTGESVPGWKSMSDIESPADVDVGDYVTYDHWIGQVSSIIFLSSSESPDMLLGCRGKPSASIVYVALLNNHSYLTKLSWKSQTANWFDCPNYPHD